MISVYNIVYVYKSSDKRITFDKKDTTKFHKPMFDHTKKLVKKTRILAEIKIRTDIGHYHINSRR